MTRTPAFLAARLGALHGAADQPLRDELILDALGDPSPAVREVAVAWAARYLDPGALLPRMAEEADAIVRNAALAALVRQGPFAVEAVSRSAADPDADVAMFACNVLGAIGSAAATPALLAALERSEVNVVQAAIEALGRIRPREAVAPLIAVLDREPWLQLSAVDALGAIGDPAAVGALLALVPDSFVAEPALDALRRIGAPEALPALLPLLTDTALAGLRLPLVRAIGGILPAARPSDALRRAGRFIEGDHGTESVWRLLADRLTGEEDEEAGAPGTDDDRRRLRGGGVTARAAGCVVLAMGIESLMPLVIRRAQDPDWAAWIIPVARRFDAPGAGLVRSLPSHADPEVRAGALRVLAPERIGAEILMALTADSDRAVRIAALEALGVLGGGAAAGVLLARLTTESSDERAAAARALARLPEAALAAVLAPRLQEGTAEADVTSALLVLTERRLPDWDERVLRIAGTGQGPFRLAALRAAARIPGSGAEVVLLRGLADRDPVVQLESLNLLAAHAGDRVIRTLVALLAVADSLRYHVIRALGRIGAADAAGPLEALFLSAPLHEQLEILATLERLGNPRSHGFMMECLHHAHPEIRRAAAQGFATLATAEDLETLHRLSESQDWVLRSEAARAFGRIGLPSARPRLLDLVRDLEPVVARTARDALGSWP